MSHVGTAPGLAHDHAELQRKRLLFRCWHHGTQEHGPIFDSVAESAGGRLSTPQLGRFEALLDCDDTDLFDWVTGRSTSPPVHDRDVMRLLRYFSVQKKG